MLESEMKSVICNTMTEKGYLLKGLKTWNSHEGGGFQVSLYNGKSKIATFIDEGNGGMLDVWEVFSQTMLDEFMEDCKALPQWFCFDKMIDTDYEIVISEMVNEFENKKHLDRLLKKNVIATKPDGKEYVWKITPHWTREKLTAMVREKGYTNIQGAA